MATFAKITRPSLAGVFPKKRLFRLLDRRRLSPVVFINGPPGSGKTSCPRLRWSRPQPVVLLGPDHKIREGDAIDYEIVLRNTGSKRPDDIELWNSLDSSAMLASAPELSYNLENRKRYWQGTIDPGEERRFAVKLVTIPKSAGTWVSNHASFWDNKRKGIQSDPLEVRSKENNARILFTEVDYVRVWYMVGHHCGLHTCCHLGRDSWRRHLQQSRAGSKQC